MAELALNEMSAKALVSSQNEDDTVLSEIEAGVSALYENVENGSELSEIEAGVSALHENVENGSELSEIEAGVSALHENVENAAVSNENVAKTQIINENKYITFRVSNELYGIDVSFVDSIIQLPAITRVPAAPSYFAGIINLRGEIIPVMSLNRRFNGVEDTFGSKSSIIVLDMGGDKLMGIIIDDVREVVTFDDRDLEGSSPFISKEMSFISSIAKKEDDLIAILDIATLL
ncbi:MAG: chemotaxis protein CheW [Butyrivibrio sp.]|uniref:chemotaxis protein CheW n=1 Tax=Butyrivibrio sp. TaxID=28121 RepID=UPI0025F5B0F8|nr:chemotaxis protein CheW [Butyrivibrio sp.]MCR5770927.1 chemotaxis protein CheW [Butyrivibrio sp.]